jgi:hypothetical protein
LCQEEPHGGGSGRLTPIHRFALVSFACVLAIPVAMCSLGAKLPGRHLIERDAVLVADLVSLLLAHALTITVSTGS